MALALTMYRNKTAVWFASVYQSDGITPQPLTGTTLWFHAEVGGISIDKSSPSSGIAITNSAGGANCATLTIAASDTASLQADSLYQGKCELTLASGATAFELDTGTIAVYPEVSTP